MALLINYTRFIPRFIGVVRQRGIKSRHERIFSLRASLARYVRLNETPCRSVVTLAQEEPNPGDSVEERVFRLSEDLRMRNIFFNDVMNVFSAVKEKGKITDSHFVLFMKCCTGISLISTPTERVQFAEKVWMESAKSGMQFTVAHFNALLNVFLECNHMFSSSEFLKNIRDSGIEPNATTLRGLFKAHCQRGDSKGVNNILAEMKNKNLPLTADEFTALIQCSAISGDFDKCKEILKLMGARDIDPSPWAYTYLLCGYAKHGKIEELKETLEELPNKCVKLSNLHLAEIVYSLVSNNFETHIQLILDKMTPNFSDNKLTLRVIHRLIREKYDSAAFKLFEKLNTMDITSDSVISNSKLILKHFALCREPEDIINAINVMNNKGWIQTGISVVLRQIYQHKDEDFCVNFLLTMMKLNMKVECHYFWPAIIKASKKSNSKVLAILKYINPSKLKHCQYTTTKLLYLYYNFSENWLADFDTLYNLGCPAKWLSTTFIKVLANMNLMKEAVKVAATYPVDIHRSSDIFNFLVDHVQKHPDDVSDFLDILYYLNHDCHLIKEKKMLAKGGDLEAVEKDQIAYVHALFTLSRFLHNENVAEMILEGMIEKGKRISSQQVTFIQRAMPQKFHGLLEKLANLEFECKIDKNVLKSKRSWEKTGKNEQRNQKALSETPHETVLYLSRMKDFNKLKIVLSELKEDLDVKEAVWKSIYEWVEKAEPNVGVELCKMAVDAGVFSEGDQLDLIRHLIEHGASTEAMTYYAEFAEEKNKAPGFLGLLIHFAKKDDQTLINNFQDIISKYVGKNLLLTSLMIAYTTVGKLEKGREIMENDFQFMTRILNKHIKLRFNFIPSETLEDFWQLLQLKTNVNRIGLYKFLIRKYAKENKLDKIKNLWLFMEEDDIWNYNFLEEIRDLVDNPSQEALEKLAKKFEEEERSKEKEKKNTEGSQI